MTAALALYQMVSQLMLIPAVLIAAVRQQLLCPPAAKPWWKPLEPPVLLAPRGRPPGVYKTPRMNHYKNVNKKQRNNEKKNK